MKAIVYSQNGLPVTDPQSLYQTELPKPQPGEHDLLVKISAISVNPVDTKMRAGSPVTQPRIPGWDAVGTVRHPVQAWRQGLLRWLHYPPGLVCGIQSG